MKQIFKKNQIIITALALMLCAAGYLQFSGEPAHCSPQWLHRLVSQQPRRWAPFPHTLSVCLVCGLSDDGCSDDGVWGTSLYFGCVVLVTQAFPPQP